MRHLTIEPGRELLEALREYQRGAQRLLSGAISEAELDSLYENMMAAAHRAGELNPILIELPKEFGIDAISETFLKHEVRTVADTFGVSKRRAAKIILRADQATDHSIAPNVVVQALAENHAAFMAGYRESMERERKEKKKRRRLIVASLQLGVAGSVVMASNAMTIGFNPWVKESVTFGGGLIVKALYDIRKG